MEDLQVSIFINATPETVWHAMAHRQEEWWCPRPWRVEIDHREPHAGGRCDMTMHGPDGEMHPNSGIFLAWDEGRRFVTTDAVIIDPATGDFQPASPFMIGIWEIAAEGEGTRYTARARHWSAEVRQQHLDMGFIDGWSACAQQLKELCEAA